MKISKNLILYLHVCSGKFNWKCANVLVGVGDSYSITGAEAFEAAAIENNIDVCTKANYERGSSNMEEAIKQIMDKICCLVTVVFGQPQDISSLLLEAHAQGYTGEWIISDSILNSLDTVVDNLNKHLGESPTHELLRGTFGFSLNQKFATSLVTYQ